MSSLLLRGVVLDGRVTDVRIDGQRFTSVDAVPVDAPADQVIDAAGRMAIVPPFYNGHTHAAMTLLRGYAEDLELGTWLSDHIWPAEATLTADDIYAGSRLAILEMIKSGTVYFNDMYWEQAATVRAVVEMGVRADIGLLHISGPDGRPNPRSAASNAELLALAPSLPDRISITHAPHSPYAVSREQLAWIAEDSARTGRRIHIHAAETADEVRDCLAAHGLTPVAYLDSLSLITERTVLAHCVHLTADDRRIIADRGAVIAHMPVSNLKLCSGFFEHHQALAAGCRVILGTDGAASNNSLSMLAEMKSAALLAKSQAGSPLAGRDHAMLSAATTEAAQVFGIDAGAIEPGRLADAMLVDLDHYTMVGDYSLTANLVYSADPGVIDTVICDGRVLMTGRVVPQEREIIADARQACARLKEQRLP
jgi:5-methylthioadenosine/S-adenosylhomocysteine deaminase